MYHRTKSRWLCGFGNDILNKTSKAQFMKELIHYTLLELKTFASIKDIESANSKF